MEERKFKVGDKVRVIINEATGFKVGDVAEVICVDNAPCAFPYEVSNTEKSDWLMESQIKLASEPETYTGLELVTMLANGELKNGDKFKRASEDWKADVRVSKSNGDLSLGFLNGRKVDWDSSMLNASGWEKVVEKFQYKLNPAYLDQLGVKPKFGGWQYLNMVTNQLGGIELLVGSGIETGSYQTWFTDEEFEQLEDPNKVKHLFSKVIETEES
ncbi:hypothetical protein cd3_061 [Carnobacterium phage cd3]|uniref:DUF1642 domain-containing protein n=1 Tax=Carnobacterium phage cd2 TaxID=2849244 RepID=A0AAE7SNI2_9CAUD|nr:hypothetical protein PQD68_gp061 [Carnobacterium phage cd2]QXP45187.1 hypothetical protein cd2_061 [Carnobacterium phage cd2]QXP45258.1 hypothetical protein cd3_061 [Carnobacterium phage cd3]